MNTWKQKIKRLIPFWLGKKLRGTYQKILGVVYKGNTYYCPYCQHSFRKMLADGEKLSVIDKYQIIGAGFRENCTCPRCYAKDRDRLIYLYLEKKTNIFTQSLRLLHIAPEAWLKELFQSLPNIHYTNGVKDAESMGYYYDRRTRDLDITDLEMKDNFYDVVICNHVLEHIIDDRKAMQEIFRVLKPGGWAILQIPYSEVLENTFEDKSILSPTERKMTFGQFDHVRIYGKDYSERLTNVGFRVERYNPKNESLEPDSLLKYALNKDEDLFIAHKPH